MAMAMAMARAMRGWTVCLLRCRLCVGLVGRCWQYGEADVHVAQRWA